MLSGQIFLGLHLDQAALRALELEFEFGAVIQISHRSLGGNDEFHGAIVELVDHG